MKSLHMLSWSMFCVFAMTACAVDVQPQTTDDQSAGTAEVPKIVQVPPELSLAQPEGTFEGNGFTANACHVELLFCRDSRAMISPFRGHQQSIIRPSGGRHATTGEIR